VPTLARFAPTDRDYVGKHNSNIQAIEDAVNRLLVYYLPRAQRNATLGYAGLGPSGRITDALLERKLEVRANAGQLGGYAAPGQGIPDPQRNVAHYNPDTHTWWYRDEYGYSDILESKSGAGVYYATLEEIDGHHYIPKAQCARCDVDGNWLPYQGTGKDPLTWGEEGTRMLDHGYAAFPSILGTSGQIDPQWVPYPDLSGLLTRAGRGVAGGYVALDGNGKVRADQINLTTLRAALGL
jgi:hypothetical protein